MPEIIKQKALQLEPVQGSYRACKFSHTFPKEKPFNYSPLQLWSEHMLIICMYVVTMRQYIISATYFIANAMLMLNCSLQGAIKGTVNLL